MVETHIGRDDETEDEPSDRLPLVHHHLVVRGHILCFSSVFASVFYLFFICYLFVCCIYIYFYICIDCLSYATSWQSGCHVLCFPFVYQSYGLSNAVCSAVFLLKVLLDHIMQDSECFIVCKCNLITVRCCFLMYF